jgi:hypothetical protein
MRVIDVLGLELIQRWLECDPLASAVVRILRPRRRVFIGFGHCA